nr:hypothetical protein Iba_chr12dCG9790 [Ipomoea batatas]
MFSEGSSSQSTSSNADFHQTLMSNQFPWSQMNTLEEEKNAIGKSDCSDTMEVTCYIHMDFIILPDIWLNSFSGPNFLWNDLVLGEDVPLKFWIVFFSNYDRFHVLLINLHECLTSQSVLLSSRYSWLHGNWLTSMSGGKSAFDEVLWLELPSLNILTSQSVLLSSRYSWLHGNWLTSMSGGKSAFDEVLWLELPSLNITGERRITSISACRPPLLNVGEVLRLCPAKSVLLHLTASMRKERAAAGVGNGDHRLLASCRNGEMPRGREVRRRRPLLLPPDRTEEERRRWTRTAKVLRPKTRNGEGRAASRPSGGGSPSSSLLLLAVLALSPEPSVGLLRRRTEKRGREEMVGASRSPLRSLTYRCHRLLSPSSLSLATHAGDRREGGKCHHCCYSLPSPIAVVQEEGEKPRFAFPVSRKNKGEPCRRSASLGAAVDRGARE